MNCGVVSRGISLGQRVERTNLALDVTMDHRVRTRWRRENKECGSPEDVESWHRDKREEKVNLVESSDIRSLQIAPTAK